MTAEPALTPDLLDLMEHEKVIEQGLAAFVEMGAALEAIQDGKKYRAAGFTAFGDYTERRWGISRRHAYQLIDASRVAREVCSIAHTLEPVRESQVRPLKALPTPEAAEAWAEAVEEADGEQPTAKQVEHAVAKRLPPKKEHPATFSDPILDTVAKHVGPAEVVLDPFAGTGRVHELRERAGVAKTIGIEIEGEWAAKHPDTIHGDALKLTEHIEPESVDAIATSPTYGNRMADHHQAKDDSVRLTYKHSLGRDLADNNSGQMQWGAEYRAFHRRAWEESVAALKPGGTLTINCKNHIRGGEEQLVTEWHIRTLEDLGMRLDRLGAVPTRGLMAGENAATRTAYEWVVTMRKPA